MIYEDNIPFLPSGWQVQPWRPVSLHKGGVDVCSALVLICPEADARDERQSDESAIVMENHMPCSFFQCS